MLLFNVGEIAYLTHGVGERRIEAVIINKINRKTAIVETFVGGREFEVSVGALIRDRDLIQEVFDYVNNNIKDMKKRELSEAIKKNNIDKVKKLINAGVDVNAKYDDAITALHYASIYNRPEIAKKLINAGADINARDKEGKTAFDIAKEEDYQEIIDLLENYNKKTKNYGKTTIQCN